MSLPHLLWLSSGPVSRHICLTYHILTPCDCTVPAQWRSLLSDTIIVLVTYLLTYSCGPNNNFYCFDHLSHTFDDDDELTRNWMRNLARSRHHEWARTWHRSGNHMRCRCQSGADHAALATELWSSHELTERPANSNQPTMTTVNLW